MRFKFKPAPSCGERRTIVKFSLLPRFIDGGTELIWLEKVVLYQQYDLIGNCSWVWVTRHVQPFSEYEAIGLLHSYYPRPQI